MKTIKLFAMPILITGAVASIVFLAVGFLTMNLLILLPSVFCLTLIAELIHKVLERGKE